MRDALSLPTIQAVYEATSAVLNGSQPVETLRAPLADWNEVIDYRESPRGLRAVESARDLYTDESCDVEIDTATVAYHNGDGGHWVMAWVFVPDDEDDGRDEKDANDDTADLPVTISDPAGR